MLLVERLEVLVERRDDLHQRIALRVVAEQVEGVVLAQEIVFRDTSAGPAAEPRPARLFSGVLRGEDIEQTLLQMRLTEEELEERGMFAQDEIELRGGPNVAPNVIAALRYSLDREPEELG